MKKDKKPDNVVFNTGTQKYDAALKSYGTNVGAPVIKTNDTTLWKKRSINKVNHKVQTKYLELKAEYERMIEEFEHNKLIFEAKFSFEPIVGENYHLYKRDNDDVFLSLIPPNQCNFNFLGSFYLNADQTWEKI
jgi:hypothetical protein